MPCVQQTQTRLLIHKTKKLHQQDQFKAFIPRQPKQASNVIINSQC